MEQAPQQAISNLKNEEGVNKSPKNSRVRFPSSERMAQTLSEREESKSESDLSIKALELQLIKEEEMSEKEKFEVLTCYNIKKFNCNISIS